MSTQTEETRPLAKKKKKVPFNYSPFIRGGKLPHIWCPGCGHGIVLKSLLRAVQTSGLSQDDIAVISGIGCSSRTPGYIDFNTLHTLHGRALAYATGVKLAKPKLKVIVTTGDGDALALPPLRREGVEPPVVRRHEVAPGHDAQLPLLRARDGREQRAELPRGGRDPGGTRAELQEVAARDAAPAVV